MPKRREHRDDNDTSARSIPYVWDLSSRGSRTWRGVGSRSSSLRIRVGSLPRPLPSAAALRDESTFAGGFVGRERLGSGAGLVIGKLLSLVPCGGRVAGLFVVGACIGLAYL